MQVTCVTFNLYMFTKVLPKIMAMRNEARRCLDTFKSEYADTFCRIGEVLLSFASGILTVVTFGTGFWLQATFQGTSQESPPVNSYHFGLWQNCSALATSDCSTIPLKGPSE